jgi:hypothetical protein
MTWEKIYTNGEKLDALLFKTLCYSYRGAVRLEVNPWVKEILVFEVTWKPRNPHRYLTYILLSEKS